MEIEKVIDDRIKEIDKKLVQIIRTHFVLILISVLAVFVLILIGILKF